MYAHKCQYFDEPENGNLKSNCKYDALAVVAEKKVQWRPDFQCGSRVLKMGYGPFYCVKWTVSTDHHAFPKMFMNTPESALDAEE